MVILINIHRGKILSDETKQKLRDINIGKTVTLSKESANKISKATKDKNGSKNLDDNNFIMVNELTPSGPIQRNGKNIGAL